MRPFCADACLYRYWVSYRKTSGSLAATRRVFSTVVIRSPRLTVSFCPLPLGAPLAGPSHASRASSVSPPESSEDVAVAEVGSIGCALGPATPAHEPSVSCWPASELGACCRCQREKGEIGFERADDGVQKTKDSIRAVRLLDEAVRNTQISFLSVASCMGFWP